VHHHTPAQNSINEDLGIMHEEDTMSACPRQRLPMMASNDNGFLPFRQDAMAPLSKIVRVATEAVGSISLTYIADGVLAITQGQPAGRATMAHPRQMLSRSSHQPRTRDGDWTGIAGSA
jgi:hypothetical protein